MSTSEQNEPSGQSLSLPTILALLIGGGALFVNWKFDFLFMGMTEGWRLLYLMLAIATLGWGVFRSFGDPFRVEQRRFRFGRNQVSLPRPGQFYLVLMIVIFSGSLLGRSNMLMLVFTMLAGPFVVNGWITYSMLKRTSVSRSAPAHVMADEPTTIELELSNRKRLMSCWLLSARDRMQNGDERVEPSILFARVPAGEHRSGHYHARLARRGRYRFGPVKLTARFPLGIVERGLVFDLPGEILVYPRLGRLSSRWMRENFLAADLVEKRELRQGSFDDEFHRIREFRWGDNPKAIHWRTSARHNALMVREYHQSRDLSMSVLVDLWQPHSATIHHRERIELAVSLAATICISHMRQSHDSKLSVAIAGRRFDHWEGESRMSNSDPLLDQFAMAEGVPSPPLKTMLEHGARKRVHGTRNVLVTTRSAGSVDRRDLDRIIREENALDAIGGLEILEADFSRLGSVFELT